MKQVLCLLLFITTTLGALSQKVLLTAKTDKQKILIGEPITLMLEAIVTGGEDIQWTKFDTLPHFEVMNRSDVDTQRIRNGILYKQSVILTSWDSGSWNIPPITISGSRSLPIPINVDHTPFDYNQPYNEVKTIIDIPKEKDFGWHWYLIGAVLIIMLFYLFFPEGKQKEEVHYKGNAYEEALQQLHNLKADHNDPVQVKIYYTKLVQVLRDYVYRKKKLYSYSKTTDDLVAMMNQLQLPAELQSELKHTLMTTDMVKFAKYRPQKEENDASLRNIKQAIITIENRK
jgi:hypothetical protein